MSFEYPSRLSEKCILHVTLSGAVLDTSVQLQTHLQTRRSPCVDLTSTVRLSTVPNLPSHSLYSVCVPVPTSSDKMLEKSLTTNSDVIIYDLEDSVPPAPMDKESARRRLKDFFDVCTKLLNPIGVDFSGSIEPIG